LFEAGWCSIEGGGVNGRDEDDEEEDEEDSDEDSEVGGGVRIVDGT
jgi:hypothetical protein